MVLTGACAYKIKKAIRLPFLDFGTLDARQRFCEREVALNRRFAPGLYLGVVPITGSTEAPIVGGAGPAIEYAVKMCEFPQDALLSSVLARGELNRGHIDALIVHLAAFHRDAAVAAAGSTQGDPGRILDLALANFCEIAPLLSPPDRTTIVALEAWTRREHKARTGEFARRQAEGAIRECHGDLHLANIVLIGGQPTLFDGVEFNDAMRWIDVVSEVAFTIMDLEHRGERGLACRLLSGYLEGTGDYAGCAVLRFYLVYRAMVRAKVACLRAQQLTDSDARSAAWNEFHAYLALAAGYTDLPRCMLMVMHGLSGCGKSWLSERLVECVGAVRIRTDVERKRLAGLAANARSGSSLDSGLYAPETTHRIYEHALTCAGAVVEGNFAVVVDATFLQRWQRRLARDQAHRLGAGFLLIDCTASMATLRTRLVARAQGVDDASEAGLSVLEHQVATREVLGRDELCQTIACDTEDAQVAANACRAIGERIGLTASSPGG
ncbi:MAG: AAA family ATPase [Casimicrobiaceae bacterium]